MKNEFDILISLEAQTGKIAIIRLLTLYRTKMREALAQLLDKGSYDLPAVKKITHRMLGSCGSLGFYRMADLFEQMDEAADCGDIKTVVELVGLLKIESDILDRTLCRHYPDILDQGHVSL